jgi:hypothetical protein
MLFERKSMLSGKVHTREINVTQAQIDAWEAGATIQSVMADLSADDREFIMTGITPDEWDEAFGEDDEGGASWTVETMVDKL